MLTSTEYIALKAMRSGSLEVSPEVVEQGEDLLVISRRRLPAKLPGFIKRFVGEEVVINETQRWLPAASPDARDGTFVIDFGGQPMAFQGTLQLRGDDAGTRVTTDATIKASVPLIGRKAEAVAMSWTERYLRKEEEVAAEWLNGGA